MLARIFKVFPKSRKSSFVLARVVDGELQEARIDLKKTSSTKDRVESFGIEGSIWAEASVNQTEMFAQIGEIFSREATARLGTFQILNTYFYFLNFLAIWRIGNCI